VSASPHIRPAEPGDVELIFSLIVELAEYERAREQVTGSPQLLADALFGPEPVAEALIAELDGQPVGFALFYTTFSTWEARPGLWLEDIYVPHEHRRGGIGQALIAAVAATAVSRGFTRLEWAALHWNEPALAFYRKLGARRLDDWVLHRLEADALAAAATGPRTPERAGS
jgi:GNAT superfamily N-acetyltransferase